MKKRKVTPELIEELRRVQQNAWGKVTLEVVYRPEYYGGPVFDDLPDIGEIVAYAINEGKVTEDSITELEETDLSVRWQVRPESADTREAWDII